MRLFRQKSLRDAASFKAREDVTRLLNRRSVGAELGVAGGTFSRRLLETGKFRHLYSIDRWGGDRGHDILEYRSAIERLMPFRDRNTPLRMSFSEALPLFPDHYFDFIYVDGYAHTGQEAGETLREWWPKLKPGGILAGDDYAPDWPLVVKYIDEFIAERSLPFAVFNPPEKPDAMSQFPTWMTRKPD